jgi:NitT/TauT family transport system substrate-binding protein
MIRTCASKTIVFLFAAIALFAVLVGSSSNLAAAAEPVKTKIAIVTWVGYGPLFVAVEKGFFKKHNVDVDIVTIEELGARHAALISGDVGFSISTVDLFANEAAQGLPAVAIAKLSDSAGADGIVVKNEIKSVKDLKGKLVAFEKATPSHFFLINLLEAEGLSTADIKPIFMTAGDAGAAFVAGHVDAAATWEPWLTKAKETSFGHILITSKEKAGLLVDLLLVNRTFARTHPEAVEGVLRAWFEAVEYWKNNENDANQIMAKGLGLETDEFMAMLKGDHIADYEENRKYFGLANPNSRPFFQLFSDAQKIWMKEGLISSTGNAENFVDTSFLRSLDR